MITMKNELETLGLTSNEASIYMSLADIGQCKAGEIIRKTGLHRNIVYENLEKLIAKGLVSSIAMNGIRHFAANPPEKLKEYVERQENEFKQKQLALAKILPAFKAKEKQAGLDAAVFKGKDGLKNLFEQLAAGRGELLIFATGWGMKETMGPYYHQWHAKLKSNRIAGRAVLSRKMRSSEEFPYQIKHLSDEMVLPSTIIVQGNTVATVVWGEQPLAVLIRSEKAAESYKTYFELLWKGGKV